VSIALAVLGSLRLRERRPDLTALSLGLVAGVVGQIALGALTVKFELAPPFVMGHFLLSLALVTNAVVLYHRAGEPPTAPVTVVSGSLRRLTWALGPALAVAVLAGTVVTGTGPHGGDEDAPRFGFDIEAVARVHSLSVLVFVGLLLVVHSTATRERAPHMFVARIRWLLGVSVAQAAIGWVQYFTGVPVVLVGLHILGATVVWAAMCFAVLACRVRPLASAPAEPVGTGALLGQN
jgi:cytochrome c oxidase assembly protein subunit 15